MTTIRAAVLEGVGGDLEVQELDLAPPRAGEVQVRLLASGVCHSDLNAIDGTAETRCPAVLGHEGAGMWPLRRVPGRPATPVRHGLADDGAGHPAGWHDAAVAWRRAGLPLLV